MTTHFIEAEIELQANPVKLKQEIEKELLKRGQPLRWSIAAVKADKNKASVEAIVTLDSE